MVQVVDAPPLTINVGTDGWQPSVVVHGKADRWSVDDVVCAIDRLAGECECCVSLDMAGVESMDAAALEGFAGSASALKRRNRRLRLKNASEPVREIIDRHLLSDLFCSKQECMGSNAGACAVAARDFEIDVFSLPSSMAYCREARARVSRVADAAGFDSCELSDVLLAVGEAVANAVTHGNTGRSDSIFTVSCVATAKKLCVSVSDSGDGFCPTNLPSMEDALFLEHGRGVHCMEAVMDEVTFHFGHGTTVRMVKSGR